MTLREDSGRNRRRKARNAAPDEGSRRARPGPGVPCVEAQADGFPCPELRPDCSQCAEEMAALEGASERLRPWLIRSQES